MTANGDGVIERRKVMKKKLILAVMILFVFVSVAQAATKEERENVADNLDTIFIKMNYDIRIKVWGKENEIIRFSYIFFNRPEAINLMDAGLGKILRRAGFKRIIFTDGYDFIHVFTNK